MCGIWGLVTKNNEFSLIDIKKIINAAMLLSESRGKEAAGVAIATGTEVSIYKRPVSASRMIASKKYNDYLEKAITKSNGSIAAIGHARLVTNGTQYHSENNQPVTKNGMVVVHNGIIVNEQEIRDKYAGFTKATGLDTEVFLDLFHQFVSQQDSVAGSLRKAYNEIIGTASVLGFFSSNDCLFAASNNGSLYYCVSEEGNSVFFASERITIHQLCHRNVSFSQKFTASKIRQINSENSLLVNTSTLEMQILGLNNNKEIVDFFAHQNKKMVVRKSRQISKGKQEINISVGQYKQFEIDIEPIKKIRRCTKCLLPATMPFIQYDKDGVCNYCRTYKKQEYKDKEDLLRQAESWKAPNRIHDSFVSFSGGRDSSYGLHYFVKELGLRPLAYCYDWGMVTDLARRNQARMCGKLGVEMILISADIKKKRDNIRKNVTAWLKNPDIGMIPLFMAGDKQYFYYANQVRKTYGLDTVLLASNPFEVTHFKTGFCGVKPAVLNNIAGNDEKVERLPAEGVLRLGKYYMNQYLRNPSYINTSIIDTIGAAASYYVIPHNYYRLFSYVPWDEREVERVLLNEYDWETANDTKSTWRIGDGTAPFYNYIYYLVCGFTENDTLRSNQIREGMLSREEGMELVYRDNQPRFESLKWYFDTIGMDMFEALKVIQKIKKLY